jgi:hypothetical protein
MRIYDIHNQHPEWVENPQAHKEEIRDTAHTYVMEFFKMGADVRNRVLFRDLNAMAGNRQDLLIYSQYQGDPESDKETRAKVQILEKVFRYIIRYLAYYGYVLNFEEVEEFYKDSIVGDNTFSFIDIEEWPTNAQEVKEKSLNDFLETLRGIERNESQHINYIDLGDDTAKALYIELNDQNTIIDCSEKTFLWYFGSDKNRADIEQPERIKWYERANAFAYLCLLIKIRITGSTEYKQIDWEKAKRIFSNETDSSWKSQALSNYVSGYRNNESLPDNFDITALSKAKEKLVELRKKMEK